MRRFSVRDSSRPGAARNPPTPRAVAAAVLLLGCVGCAPLPELGADPGSAEEAYRQGTRLFEEGPERFRAAARELAAACADVDTCRRAMPYLADGFLEAGEVERGAELFGQIAARHPELAAAARGYRGYFLEKAGYPLEAAEEYRYSLAHAPTARVFRWLGNLQMRIGERAAAIRTFARGVAGAPQDADLHYLLGRALRVDGQRARARAHLETAVRLGLDHGGAWVSLGRLHAETGEEQAAVAAFRRALDLDPRNIEGRFMLARRALRAGRDEETDRLLREIRDIEATLGRGPRED